MEFEWKGVSCPVDERDDFVAFMGRRLGICANDIAVVRGLPHICFKLTIAIATDARVADGMHDMGITLHAEDDESSTASSGDAILDTTPTPVSLLDTDDHPVVYVELTDGRVLCVCDLRHMTDAQLDFLELRQGVDADEITDALEFGGPRYVVGVSRGSYAECDLLEAARQRLVGEFARIGRACATYEDVVGVATAHGMSMRLDGAVFRGTRNGALISVNTKAEEDGERRHESAE